MFYENVKRISKCNTCRKEKAKKKGKILIKKNVKKINTKSRNESVKWSFKINLKKCLKYMFAGISVVQCNTILNSKMKIVTNLINKNFCVCYWFISKTRNGASRAHSFSFSLSVYCSLSRSASLQTTTLQ